MKRLINFFAIFVILNIAFAMFPKQTSAQNNEVNFQVFYDALSPYGQWVDYPNYGFVWLPNAGPDFVPYSSAGHWILTDYGWTWVSDYEWGWAPFHYGRWNFDNNYGWFWVPGNEWAPAWVIWRHARGYYGWAPLAPGISLSIAYGRDYRMPYDRWTFVGERDFCRPDFYQYNVDRSRNYNILYYSTVINTTYVDDSRHSTYYYGPRREDVQYYSGHVVRVVNIRENDRPAQNLNNNQLNIYRPRMQNTEKDRTITPAKVYNIREVKPIANRNNVNNAPNNNVNRQNYQQQNNYQQNRGNEHQNANTPYNNNPNRQNYEQQKINQPNEKGKENHNNVPQKNNNIQPQPKNNNNQSKNNDLKKSEDKNDENKERK